MEEFAADAPLPIDFAQHSVGATATDETITLSSLSMTGSGDVVDTEVEVFDGTNSMGTVPVTSVLTSTPFDESGTATIPNTLPNDGELHLLRIVGETTGTDVLVPVIAAPKTPVAVSVSVNPDKIVVDKTKARVIVRVDAEGEDATGRIEVKVGGETYEARLKNGRAVVKLESSARPARRLCG